MSTGIIAASRLRVVEDTNSFISVWDTTKPGITNNNQVQLPVVNKTSSIINATIDWGDGNSNTFNSRSDTSQFTHTYTNPGIYTIKISGIYNDFWGFDNTGDKNKIIEVLQWGDQSPPDADTLGQFMYGCSNLTLNNVIDTLNFSGSGVSWFRDCNSLTNINNVNDWSIDGIANFARFFQGCNNLILEIQDWKIGRISGGLGGAFFMTGNAFIPTVYYDQLLINVANDPQLLNNRRWDFANSKYTIGSAAETARSKLINVNGWTINDGGGI